MYMLSSSIITGASAAVALKFGCGCTKGPAIQYRLHYAMMIQSNMTWKWN